MKTPLDQGALRARINAGEFTVGSFSGFNTSMGAEVLASAGCDWVIYDLEHGGATEEHLGVAAASAGAYGTSLLVRVETAERIRVGRALDAGAAGVMIPRLNSASEAQEALTWLHYPPQGIRGVATYNRSVRWGADTEALKTANESAVGIIQIETRGALDDVDQIAAMDGVDVLFIGPLDLSYALGTPLDFSSEIFVQAVDRVLVAAQKHGKTAGILTPNLEAAQQRQEQGFDFLGVGSDTTLLAATARTAMNTLRKDTSG